MTNCVRLSIMDVQVHQAWDVWRKREKSLVESWLIDCLRLTQDVEHVETKEGQECRGD